jgi:molecular chaperone GrpE
MMDTTARPSDGAAAQPTETTPSAAQASTADGRPAAEDTAPPQTDPAETLAREVAEYKDKLLRTLAEMENLRRRTEREIADTRHYGISAFARDILAVADNMGRALQALDADLRQKADAATKALLDGVELTERELLKALEKHGVKRFEPVGERFDPNLHQAMYEVEDARVPSGQVVQVVQPGYMIAERVLRPAMVAVAKGGPKPSAPGQPQQQANDNTNSGSAGE